MNLNIRRLIILSHSVTTTVSIPKATTTLSKVLSFLLQLPISTTSDSTTGTCQVRGISSSSSSSAAFVPPCAPTTLVQQQHFSVVNNNQSPFTRFPQTQYCDSSTVGYKNTPSLLKAFQSDSNNRSFTWNNRRSFSSSKNIKMDSSSQSDGVRRSTRRRSTRIQQAKSNDDTDNEISKNSEVETEEIEEEVVKKKRRVRKTKGSVGSSESEEEGSVTKTKKKTVKKVKKVIKTKKLKSSSKSSSSETTPTPSSVSESTSATNKNDSDSESESPPPAKKKKTAPKKKTTVKKPKVEAQRITDRDDIPKLWDGKKAMETSGSYTFKIISWNVAGLRAVLKNHPQAIPKLATHYQADVICLQETKLQEMHVEDPKLKIGGYLLEEEGYDSYYSCSTTKKGYSGTAVFVKRRVNNNGEKSETKPKKKGQAKLSNFFNATASTKTKKETESDSATKSNTAEAESKPTGDIDIQDLIPNEVSYKINNKEHDAEGRTITVDFPLFSLTNVYVPNSGQKLERLSYRTDSWDVDFLNYMKGKKKNNGDDKPVIWLGDLNVAHTFRDVWNNGAKHLAKQAGVTAEERASFDVQLDGGSEVDGEESDSIKFVDSFRHLHPEALGHYSYWSQRAGNREPNKGLRLDYFIASDDLFEKDGDGVEGKDNKRVVVRDSYILPEHMGSDHCPVVLELEIKKP